MKFLICPECTLRNEVIETTCLRCGSSLAEVVPREVTGEEKVTRGATPKQTHSAPIDPAEQARKVVGWVRDVGKKVASFDPRVTGDEKYPHARFFIEHIAATARFAYTLGLVLHSIFVFFLVIILIGLAAEASQYGGDPAGTAVFVFGLFFVAVIAYGGYAYIKFWYMMKMAVADFFHAFLQIESNTRQIVTNTGQSSRS